MVQGSLLHAYGDTLQVGLANGDTLILKRDEISKILFVPEAEQDEAKATTKQNLPAPQAKAVTDDPTGRFATPEKTFEIWRQALRRGDRQEMAECFIAAAQPLILKKLEAIDKSRWRQMVKEAKKAKFTISVPFIEGDRATLGVTRRLKRKTFVEDLSFMRENNQWKLIPKEE